MVRADRRPYLAVTQLVQWHRDRKERGALLFCADAIEFYAGSLRRLQRFGLNHSADPPAGAPVRSSTKFIILILSAILRGAPRSGRLARMRRLAAAPLDQCYFGIWRLQLPRCFCYKAFYLRAFLPAMDILCKGKLA